MKTILILLTFAVASISNDLSALRKLYPKAADNKENAESFCNIAFGLKSEDALVLGYKGAAYTLQAKFDRALLKKKENFIKGVEMLEQSIEKQPANIELRVLRMSIQENSPKFLNYNTKLEEDKKMIVSQFSNTKSEVRTFVVNFIENSNSFSAEEKKTYGK